MRPDDQWDAARIGSASVSAQQTPQRDRRRDEAAFEQRRREAGGAQALAFRELRATEQVVAPQVDQVNLDIDGL